MNIRQIILNLSYEGAIANTSVVEFDGPDKNLPPRNATPEDMALIGDATSAGYLARITELETEAATLDAVRAELAASQATLVEHQAHADRLVAAATVAINAGDREAIERILHDASLFGSAREMARLNEEAEGHEIKLAEIAAKKAALK